jgi:hypothetical protein
MPEWVVPILFQIPLVAVVAWAFVTGAVHSDNELKRRESDHDAEMKRRVGSFQEQIADWRTLYQQERVDRLAADARLVIAVAEIKDATDRVEDLTKEVIRVSRP